MNQEIKRMIDKNGIKAVLNSVLEAAMSTRDEQQHVDAKDYWQLATEALDLFVNDVHENTLDLADNVNGEPAIDPLEPHYQQLDYERTR